MSHQCPGLISNNQAESGAPSHSRKRGWFNGTPSPPSGRAWSSTLCVVCRNVHHFPRTRREARERSFGNGPSRANRHRGTVPRSPLLVGIDNGRFAIRASSHKMSLKRKSSAGVGDSFVGHLVVGRRDRRRCTERIRSSTIGVQASESVVPTCTVIESREFSTGMGDSCSRGGGDDLSSSAI